MNLFKQISLKLRFVKVQRFIGSLVYPLQRDWWERQISSSPTSKPFQKPGKILQVNPTDRGVNICFEQAKLEVCFLATDLVRIDWKPGIPPIPYGISRQEWQEVETTFQETADAKIISSAALKVIIKTDGSVEFQDAAGQTLREELPPQRQGEAWSSGAQLRDSEHIYGLGERAAPLNLRSHPGRSYQMWNYDAGGKYCSGTDPLYLCIPVYLGLHKQGSYLIFYENPYPANFNFRDVATASFEGGALRYYLTSGKPAELLQRYTELTGRPPLPPRWAFGYHQSRWGYGNEEAVRETAKAFQTHDLPLSAIHLDIDCQDRFRAFTIDPDRFPNLRGFTEELAALGVHLITIINPGVKSDRKSKLFQEGRAQDVFCKLANGKPIIAPVWPGWCAFPDFSDPLARHWWSRQYEYLLDLGVTGFWHDMNEPGIFVLWGDPSLPRSATRHCLEGRGGDHREVHNVYGMLQAQAGYEALRDYRPLVRPFIVSRAGWAGLQRYAWTWTGDVETSWQGLRQTIPTVLGMGLSGIPYTGPDIGGFKGNPSPELYLRWFQMANFLPFCRTHSADNVKHRTPWLYGEPYLSIIREFLRLRYRLLPYFYTLAWQASQFGYPPVRPLFWFDSDDERLWSVEDAFFLGDALLVYPIVEEEDIDAKISTSKRSRSAILPKGHWYNFWDDAVIEGSQQVNFEAPLERIPLLVKAGSILPMEVDRQLILHLYPPVQGNCEGVVYSDAGDGYGEWRLDQFRMVRSQEGLELTWEQQGDYAFPYAGVQLHLHGFKPQRVWVDGTEVAVEAQKLECEPPKGVVPLGHPFHQVRFQGKFTNNTP